MKTMIMGRAESEERTRMAKMLFGAAGKNPYYRGELVIKNFKELRDHIGKFTEGETGWVAAWIEYLGDRGTAARIKQTPKRFKDIINARYEELKRYAT